MTEKIILSVSIIVIIGIALIIVDCARLNLEYDTIGVVISKSFSPEETNVSVGSGISSSGKTGTAVMISHKSDEYFLFVQTAKGSIKAETNMDRYLVIKEKEEVKVYNCKGWILGITYKVYCE